MITLELKPLADAMVQAGKLIDHRNTIPVLAHVLLTAKAGRLTILATDLDQELAQELPCEGDDETFTLPAKSLTALLKGQPKGSLVRLTMLPQPSDRASRNVQIDIAASKAALPTLAVEDFPRMAFADSKGAFELDGKSLADLFGSVAHCMSTEETRYYLNGIYLHTEQRPQNQLPMLTAVAIDGARLARKRIDAPGRLLSLPGIIIPRVTIGTLARLAPKADTVTTEWSETKISFSGKGWLLKSKLVDGTFPDYQRVIPAGNYKVATFRAMELEAACDAAIRAQRAAGSDRYGVHLSLEDGVCEMTTVNPDAGVTGWTIPCRFDAKPLAVGFNAALLASHCAAMDGYDIKLIFADAGSPVLVRDPSDAGWLGVIMPLRV